MSPRTIRTFAVLPQLPERLRALHELASNLWLSWNHEAIALFIRIDADLWESTGHSPIKLLGAVDQARLEQLLDDDGFLNELDRAEAAFDAYMAADHVTGVQYGRSAFPVEASQLPTGPTVRRPV